MKQIFIFVFAVIASISGFSQTKILFDATKAETAGNADWVIDADNFNLDYTPNATLGGNEANAQKTPTPAQANITSSTGQDYWKGGISAWGVDAVKLGYQVETLPYNGQITYGDSNNPQDLSNYKVFVVCEPNLSFSSSEKTAIMNFIQNGGGLFMVSDHDNSDRNNSGTDSPHIWNDLMQNNSIQQNPFGFSFDYDNFNEENGSVADLPNDSILHGNYGDVTQVQFYGGTSLTLNPSDNSTVKGLLYKNGYSSGNHNVLAACARFGNGKVVAIGDSSPADDGTGDDNDNLYDGWIHDANGNHERFFMNATIWLATDNTSSINNLQQNSTFGVIVNNNQLLIKSNRNKTYNLRISNITGQTIYNKSVATNQTIYLPLHANEMYFYQISKTSTIFKTVKFVVLR